MRHINRRQFTGGLSFAATLQCRFAVAQDVLTEQVITATKTQTQLLDQESPPTEHWLFKTTSDQPIVRAQQGKELRLRFINELDEAIWVHFFGVRGPNDIMTIEVPAGVVAGVGVVFTPPDAGTFWFGPLLKASKHREMGLIGMLIVEEMQPTAFHDVPLVFDDWSLDDDGKIDPDFTKLERAVGEGRLGNWFTVNGMHKPRITLSKDKPIRLRLLNVANTRSMNIAFKGAEAQLIARDGHSILPQALGLEPLELQPGQRADLVLTEAQEQIVIALDLFEDVVEIAFLEASDYGSKPLPPGFELPRNPVSTLDPTKSPRQVSIDIEGGTKGGLVKAQVGKDVLDLRAMLEQGLAWSIGGSAGLGGPPLFAAQKGENLILVIHNKTAFEQVLHIHGHVWLAEMPIVDAATSPQISPNWTDTLVIPQQSIARVLMVADNVGTWAIQSLLAERCDAGLIGSFTVADMP